jgi:hypothetical protein
MEVNAQIGFSMEAESLSMARGSIRPSSGMSPPSIGDFRNFAG